LLLLLTIENAFSSLSVTGFPYESSTTSPFCAPSTGREALFCQCGWEIIPELLGLIFSSLKKLLDCGIPTPSLALKISFFCLFYFLSLDELGTPPVLGLIPLFISDGSSPPSPPSSSPSSPPTASILLLFPLY
jgi:hypothetical protein